MSSNKPKKAPKGDYAVGYARPARFERVAIGTDGLGGDVLEEFRLAYALARARDLDFTPAAAWKWVQTGYQLVPGAALPVMAVAEYML